MENGLAGIWGEEIAGAGEYLRAGEIPGRSTGDPGRVPLSLRATAKGGERGTQLASLRQVFLVLQRSHPRAKRKPDPRIKVLLFGSSPLVVIGKMEKAQRAILLCLAAILRQIFTMRGRT